MPVFHRALAEMGGLERPLAVLNLGGVANVTFVGPDERLVAFDAGPGNALIDDWMRERTGRAFDEDGSRAARGTPDEDASRLAPAASVLPQAAAEIPRPQLVLAPLRRPPYGRGRGRDPDRVHGPRRGPGPRFRARAAERWIAAGGGTRNRELLRLLARHVEAEVIPADDVGWSSAFLEAQAFAYLAVRSLRGLPLTFPSTTGVPEPTTGGVLAKP